MIDVSVLYSGLETPSTPHRYGRKITQIDPPAHQKMAVAKSAKDRRPIVVWNLTRTCNLKCVHCYTASDAKKYPGEIDTAKAKEVLDDLAEFRVPAVLFSGGEPLVRPDLFELAAHARSLGLHVVLSTNGTLIDREVAQKLKDLEFAYVGLSLTRMFNTTVFDGYNSSNGPYGPGNSGNTAVLLGNTDLLLDDSSMVKGSAHWGPGGKLTIKTDKSKDPGGARGALFGGGAGYLLAALSGPIGAGAVVAGAAVGAVTAAVRDSGLKNDDIVEVSKFMADGRTGIMLAIPLDAVEQWDQFVDTNVEFAASDRQHQVDIVPGRDFERALEEYRQAEEA